MLIEAVYITINSEDHGGYCLVEDLWNAYQVNAHMEEGKDANNQISASI